MRDILGDVGQIDRDGLVATGNRLEHFIDDQRGISKAQQCLVMLDQQCLRREAGTAYRQEQQEPAHHAVGACINRIGAVRLALPVRSARWAAASRVP
jgi:hypothetical protein